MNLSMETLSKLDKLIDNHNSGMKIEANAKTLDVSIPDVRHFLSLARKLGASVKRQQRGAHNMTPDARLILRHAMIEAQRKIAALNGGAYR